MNYKEQVERYCEVNNIDEGEMYQILLKVKIYTTENRGHWVEHYENLGLNSLFVWRNTPEGTEYWGNVYSGSKAGDS